MLDCELWTAGSLQVRTQAAAADATPNPTHAKRVLKGDHLSAKMEV